MLTGDRQPNASVVTVATTDVENGKRGRSCPQICLFVQVFSGQNTPDTCTPACLQGDREKSRVRVFNKGLLEIHIHRKSNSPFSCLQRPP